MASSLFVKVPFNKVRKGDLIFTMHDQNVYEVMKKTRKLAKLGEIENKKVTWVTRMRFEQREYYYLEK